MAKTIYNDDGLVLLGEHVELTDPIIKRLEHHGIDFLYIEDPRTDDIIAPDMISARTRAKAISAIKTHFRKLMEDSNLKKMVNIGHLGKDFRNVMTMIIDDLNENKDAIIMLLNMGATDYYLFQHSLNVCVYSTMLGLSYGYSNDELMTLGLGALLHDVGKTQISQNILLKPGPLDADEITEMQRHTELGFRILKDEPNIPLLAAHCAFQHHERINGSGYPRGIKGEDIHDFAKWIGIVDAYDAMTSHRVYRPAMLPHQSMDILYAGAGTLYDKSKLELFRDKIALYPLGAAVKLHSGEVGVVVDINSAFPQRPIVRILRDADGQELSQPYEIDLSKKLAVMIASVNDAEV